MTETKSDQAARIAELEADNERLRGQLAAAGARPAAVVAPLPLLTEANRLELEQQGYTSIGGVVYTSAEARDYVKRTGQDGVTWDDPAPAQQAEAERVVGALRFDPDTGQRGGPKGLRGLTHVWPSVEPGGIDPAVAGTPGISGPAAGSSEQQTLQRTPAANVATTPPAKS